MKIERLNHLKSLEIFRTFPGFDPTSLFALSDLDAHAMTHMDETKEGDKTRWMIYTGPDLNRDPIIIMTATDSSQASFTHKYKNLSFEVRRKHVRFYEGAEEKVKETFTTNDENDPYNTFKFTYTPITGGHDSKDKYRLSQIDLMRPAHHMQDGVKVYDPAPKLPVQDDKYYRYQAHIDDSTGMIDGFTTDDHVTNYPGATRPSIPTLTFDTDSNRDRITLMFSTGQTQLSLDLSLVLTQTDPHHAY